MLKINLFAMGVISFFTSCSAQKSMELKEVFMYKSGVSYCHFSGEITPQNGVWKMNPDALPAPLAGSFWLQADKQVLFVRSVSDTVQEKAYQPNTEELLLKSLNQNISLTLNTASGLQNITGKVVQVFEVPVNKNQATQANSLLAIVATSSGNVYVFKESLSKVLYASFGETDPSKITRPVLKNTLEVGFSGNPNSAKLDMVFLDNTMHWEPYYRLKFSSTNKANLTLAADITSGSTAMNNVQLNLVVGNPSFHNTSQISSLFSGYSNSGYMQPNMGGAYEVYDNAVRKAEYSAPSTEAAVEADDYFVYPVKNFSLNKYQTSQMVLLQNEVTVDDYFEGNFNPVYEYYTPTNTITPVDVFHTLAFANKSGKPWTAGPILVEKSVPAVGELAIGQPVLETVPSNGNAKVVVSKSLSIPIFENDSMVSRESGAKVLNLGGNSVSLDLVKMQGRFTVENLSKEPVTLKLHRRIGGISVVGKTDVSITKKKPLPGSFNDEFMVEWTIKLKPGEKKNYNYEYAYYLRTY